MLYHSRKGFGRRIARLECLEYEICSSVTATLSTFCTAEFLLGLLQIGTSGRILFASTVIVSSSSILITEEATVRAYFRGWRSASLSNGLFLDCIACSLASFAWVRSSRFLSSSDFLYSGSSSKRQYAAL